MSQSSNNLINSIESYGWVSILLHWLSFVMAALIFGVGLYMVNLTYYDALYTVLPEWHKALGLLLAGLTVLRILWVTINPSPGFLGKSHAQRLLARSAHLSLYLLILVLTITGYFIVTADGSDLQVFGYSWIGAPLKLNAEQAEWIGKAHRWLAYGFSALVFIHALAALYHHYVHRDNTLKRMLFPLPKQNGE